MTPLVFGGGAHRITTVSAPPRLILSHQADHGIRETIRLPSDPCRPCQKLCAKRKRERRIHVFIGSLCERLISTHAAPVRARFKCLCIGEEKNIPGANLIEVSSRGMVCATEKAKCIVAA